MTKVVVLEKFKKNWEIGSVVSVKDGYARNYLIPNGKAKIATKQNTEDIKLIEDNLLKRLPLKTMVNSMDLFQFLILSLI